MIRVGDIVRFLTEKLEGKVTSIIDKNLVNVYCDEYGFEIPAAITDLVIIKGEGDDRDESPRTTSQQSRVETEITNQVYLAITPANMHNLQNSHFELAVVNDTTDQLLFTVHAHANNKNEALLAAVAEKETKVTIGNYTIKEIDAKVKSLTIQVLYFNKATGTIKEPLEVNLKLNPVSLCKSGNYKHTKWSQELSHLRPLKTSFVDIVEEISEKEIKQAKRENNDLSRDLTSQSKETPIQKNIIEVDLHIDKLLDDTTGMTSFDMLDYQLGVFRDTLQKYKLRTGQKIVFIHGKGDGVLRQRLLWELQTKFKKMNHQDASFKQYGYGATMVTIK